MAHRIDKLLSLFDFTKIKSFFEIGGGFGANIHFLITNFPNIKKIIYLDTVPNIYVGTEYLKFHFKNKVKDYLSIKNINKIEFANNDDLEIYCIPPWEIEKINVEIDHFHNAASFVEMPDFVIKNYCKYIKKFNTKEISLISYAEYDPQTTFNPESLNNYFEKRLNISWHNLLIKEYNKKSIYLTSK
jgi:putative sugar O-methyltransferase